MPSQTEILKQQIERAFAEEKYPGNDRLVYDVSGDHLECNEIAEAFRGKHWREVSIDLLRRHSQSLFFMTPEACRFYLPAYLIAAVLNYDETDTIPGTIVSILATPSHPLDIKCHEERMKGFTPSQREVIRAFLRFLKESHGDDYRIEDLNSAIANVC